MLIALLFCDLKGDNMSPTSLEFFGFIAISLIIYYIVPKKAQWVVLLISSLFFFVYASKWVTLYMILTTVLIYGGALWIQKFNDEFKKKKKELSKEERKVLKSSIKKKQHAILTVIVVICVAILGVLKYFNFFGDIINDITNLIASRSIIPTIKLAFPLGISYYTLMSISYIVDVYRGTIQAEKNPCRLLLFVCYFPHITEGPFDTYNNLAMQFKEYHKFNYDSFMNAGSLLLLGLVKKMVLADRVAYVANEVFDNYTEYSGLPILVGMVAYTVQIYFDFSGCIDIVRGVSRMFGIDIAENFNRPFFSRSIQEFWRRWHITLGAWLKNYVFYPVSLSNVAKKINKGVNKPGRNIQLIAAGQAFLPLLCVWIVMGIWHGASWKYVVYGVYYFLIIILGMLFEPLFLKFFEKTKFKRDGKVFGLLQILRTDLLVVIGLTMFRTDTLGQFATMLKSALGLNISGLLNIMSNCKDLYKLDYLLIVVLIFVFLFIEYKSERGKSIYIDTINSITRRWLWITVTILMIILFGIYGTGYTEQPFVYAEF